MVSSQVNLEKPRDNTTLLHMIPLAIDLSQMWSENPRTRLEDKVSNPFPSLNTNTVATILNLT